MKSHPAANIPPEMPPTSPHVRRLLALFSLTLGGVLGWVVLSLPGQSSGLADLVQADLQQSGVTNPVTAVLLNFRSYDTFLEVGVLLLAVLGAWALPREHAPGSPVGGAVAGLVLSVFVRLVAPFMVVVGGYVLWIGAHAPGGAFQGGAVLAAVGVLLLLSDVHRFARFSGWPLRTVLVLGFTVFLAVAGGVMMTGGRLLEYPRQWAGGLILLIEATLTVSIACILVSLFIGALPGKASVIVPSPTQEKEQ
jgi:multisubunit Na+/H+ antiporter MnhB subunit